MKSNFVALFIAAILCVSLLCGCTTRTPVSDPGATDVTESTTADSDATDTASPQTEPAVTDTTETTPSETEPNNTMPDTTETITIETPSASYTVSAEDECIYYMPAIAVVPYENGYINFNEISRDIVKRTLGIRDEYTLICDKGSFHFSFTDDDIELRSVVCEAYNAVLPIEYNHTWGNLPFDSQNLHAFSADGAFVLSEYCSTAYFFTENGVIEVPAYELWDQGNNAYIVRYFSDENGHLRYVMATKEHFSSQPERFFARHLISYDQYYGEEGTATVEDGKVIRQVQHVYTVGDVFAANATAKREWYEVPGTAPYTTLDAWFTSAENTAEYRSLYGCKSAEDAFAINLLKEDVRKKLICLMADLRIKYNYHDNLAFTDRKDAETFSERISETFCIGINAESIGTNLDDLAELVFRLSYRNEFFIPTYANLSDFLTDEQIGAFTRADRLIYLFRGCPDWMDLYHTDLSDFPSLTQAQRDRIIGLYNVDPLPEQLDTDLQIGFYYTDSDGNLSTCEVYYVAVQPFEWNISAFRELCLTAFTEPYYEKLNCANKPNMPQKSYPTFLEMNRRLYYCHTIRGDLFGYDSDIIPDSYELICKTDTEIRFHRILHVRSDYVSIPFDVKVLSYPVVLVKDGDNWRVDFYDITA